MKRIVAVMLALILCFALCACGANGGGTATDGNVSAGNATDGNVIMEPAKEDILGESQEDATTEEVVEEALWAVDYYLDENEQITDEWFIANQFFFEGTYDNDETTDGELAVQLFVDFEDSVMFFLYENGEDLVENTSENEEDYIEFDITMEIADGETYELVGTLYAGTYCIFVDDDYIATAIDALCGEGDIAFEFVSTENSDVRYAFTVVTDEFGTLYAEMTE